MATMMTCMQPVECRVFAYDSVCLQLKLSCAVLLSHPALKDSFLEVRQEKDPSYFAAYMMVL